jgi:hypothetical protein
LPSLLLQLDGIEKAKPGSLHAAARSAHAVTVALSGIVLARLGIFETTAACGNLGTNINVEETASGGRELLKTTSALGLGCVKTRGRSIAIEQLSMRDVFRVRR